jgi:ferritin-like metal-binding protein YciE
MKDFHDLFAHELKDMYAAELMIEKALPELAKAAHSEKLKEAFRNHHKETKHHVERLKRIADHLKISLTNIKKCEAMEGILKEGKQYLKADYPHEVRDAALIISAQRVEHYEIAVYGVLKAFAKHLKYHEIIKILEETSKEEGHMDKKLTEIADGTLFQTGINAKASKRDVA